MPFTQLDPLASSLVSLTAIASLLLVFVMLGSRWLDNYLYAFVAQSWMIAVLALAIGWFGHYTELYLIAALTWLFAACSFPI